MIPRMGMLRGVLFGIQFYPVPMYLPEKQVIASQERRRGGTLEQKQACIQVNRREVAVN